MTVDETIISKAQSSDASLYTECSPPSRHCRLLPVPESLKAVMGSWSRKCLSPPHPPCSPAFSEHGVICIDCFVQLNTEAIKWDYGTISCLLHLRYERWGKVEVEANCLLLLWRVLMRNLQLNICSFKRQTWKSESIKLTKTAEMMEP